MSRGFCSFIQPRTGRCKVIANAKVCYCRAPCLSPADFVTEVGSLEVAGIEEGSFVWLCYVELSCEVLPPLSF